jgi:hypothetical protein
MALGTLLVLAGTGWVVTSVALITLLAPEPVSLRLWCWQRAAVLSSTLGRTDGGLRIFASSVIAMPLLFDRQSMCWRCWLAGDRC